MSNLNLKEMEASEMLDVLHFLMEEDFTPLSQEHAEARSALRDIVYRDMYGKKYAYPMKKAKKANQPTYDVPGSGYVGASATSDLDNLANESPFDPRTAPPKPFVPATEFNPDARNPYEGVLDAPLG